MDKLSEIKEREQKATKGPWKWDLNFKGKCLYLKSCVRCGEYVMDFVRWGMNGATARFRSLGLMTRAFEFGSSIPGQEHNSSWLQTIEHPDAKFIEHAREDVSWLISEVEHLRKLVLRDREGKVVTQGAMNILMDQYYTLLSLVSLAKKLNIQIKSHPGTGPKRWETIVYSEPLMNQNFYQGFGHTIIDSIKDALKTIGKENE
jgi:hypothetical protein